MIQRPWVCCLHLVVTEDVTISAAAFVMCCVLCPVSMDICYDRRGSTVLIFVCLTKLGGAVY